MAEVVNVPDVPGAPQLNFAAGAEEGIELLESDGLVGLPNGSSQWGIYLNGAPVVTADSVVDMTYKQEWSLSDAPQEKGAFESYDKVQIPFDCRVRFAAGGSLANRQALLSSISGIAGSLQLFDVATPESVYTSTNITHYDYKRSANSGAGLIVVDVWLFQVRVVSGSGMNATQAASGADPVNGGTVQSTDATDAQASTSNDVANDTAPASPYGDLSGAQQQFSTPSQGDAVGQGDGGDGSGPGLGNQAGDDPTIHLPEIVIPAKK